MADLGVNYCGIKFKNPLVLASATPGWDGEGMRLAAEAGIGVLFQKQLARNKIGRHIHGTAGCLFTGIMINP